MEHAADKSVRSALLSCVASLLLAQAAIAQSSACMTEAAMQARMQDEQQVEAMRAVEVFVDPAKKAKWDESTQEMGDQKYSGADMYRLLSFVVDRDQLDALERRMRKQGMSDARAAKAASEMAEFSELVMKDRFLRIKSSYRQLFLFKRGDQGVVVTQTDDKACISMHLRALTVQHYSGDLPPGWLAPSSRLPRLIEAYRKESRFGVAAFARTQAGDSIVILAKPQFGRGDHDGPVPYYFGGVLLQETKAGVASVVADLMHTRYVEHHDFNFPQ